MRRLVACARRGWAKARRVARSVGEAQAAACGARGRRSAVSILAMAVGAVTSARTVSLPPQRTRTRRSPIEPRARGVELAVEQAIPVGARQDVRRDEAGYAMPVVVRALVATSASSTKAARPSPASSARAHAESKAWAWRPTPSPRRRAPQPPLALAERSPHRRPWHDRSRHRWRGARAPAPASGAPRASTSSRRLSGEVA